jgi:hypothetical protein
MQETFEDIGTEKLGIAVSSCNPSYAGDKKERTMLRIKSGKSQ